jgi:hypothetical protein
MKIFHIKKGFIKQGYFYRLFPYHSDPGDFLGSSHESMQIFPKSRPDEDEPHHCPPERKPDFQIPET